MGSDDPSARKRVDGKASWVTRSETKKAPEEEMFNVTPKSFSIRNQINLERSDRPACAALLWITAERRGAIKTACVAAV